mgnify:CR=1 FL=1
MIDNPTPLYPDMIAYQEQAQRTSRNHGHDQILNGFMGLCGEAGEAIDILKKTMFQGHPFDHDRLVEELGDVLWYAAEAAAGLGVTLEDVAARNIEKLRRRYPNGFTAEESINRRE